MLIKHQSEEPRSLDLVRPGLPAGLAAVVAKMRAKSPANRYQTPAEVAALKPFLAAKPVPAPQLAAVPVAPAGPENVWQSVADAAEAEGPPPKRKAGGMRRRVCPAVAVGVVLLGLAAAAAGVFVKTRDGVIELTDLPPVADVFVDGDQVSVTWDSGRQKAEVRVKPGTRKVEVKQGGMVVRGETVEVETGGKKQMTVKVKPPATTPAGPPVPSTDPKPGPPPKSITPPSVCGKWSIKGDELIAGDAEGHNRIYFGGHDWTD